MYYAENNSDMISEMQPCDIDAVSGGFLPLIAIGMASVGLFTGGMAFGFAYGNHIQHH